MRTLSALLAAAALAAASSAFAGSSAKPGSPAPPLAGPELSGEAFDLSKLRGKVVIVDFWATWCAPCRAEMPLLDALYRQHRAEGLELIGISTDRPRERAKVREIMEALSYPAALSEDTKANGFGEMRIIPKTFVIDRNGVVRAALGGDGSAPTEERLKAAVLPLLAPNGDASRGR
jgi:thiol-disulfide isomerase/thioredoxin